MGQQILRRGQGLYVAEGLRRGGLLAAGLDAVLVEAALLDANVADEGENASGPEGPAVVAAGWGLDGQGEACAYLMRRSGFPCENDR
jgi:hypothetical protein